MSALVTKRTGELQWLAWCKECQDGVATKGRKKTQAWAVDHNTSKHPKEEAK